MIQVKADISGYCLDASFISRDSHVHIFLGVAGRWPAGVALVRWLKTAFTGRARKDKLHGVKRAEFEQIAQDLNLSSPELYGLLTGRRLSAESLEECLAAEFEASPQLAKRLRAIGRQHRAARIRASLPIGPSCC
ncbi:hypothetical protein [Bradyrhizobium sp. JYMT SZCCT0428]|uniref:hypothetical protein n=1 Tax=Bradyrhizobium sp. JYMT SZCCT0428 TaxID=2807673 RepID=UPI001BA9EAE3|nr:hypothetical protein [Bradyrhizobium sp. JYMT SZCCT0428]MBR1151666.1 hypothetical protein [Bradyrhizobium sp. JYMT SZCCT0428]